MERECRLVQEDTKEQKQIAAKFNSNLIVNNIVK